jgi:hypothetical protein
MFFGSASGPRSPPRNKPHTNREGAPTLGTLAPAVADLYPAKLQFVTTIPTGKVAAIVDACRKPECSDGVA